MANTVSVNQLLARNSLAAMHNELQFLKTVDRQLDNQWASENNGFKAGDTYRINRPAQFSVSSGPALAFNSGTGEWTTNDFVEDPIYVTLSANDQQKTSVQFTSREIKLLISDEKSRIGEPAGLKLASAVEVKSIKESVLRAGTAFIAKNSTYVVPADFLKAEAILDQLTAPQGKRSVLLNPLDMADLANANLTLFTPTVNADVYAKGYINEFAGAKFYSSNLVPDYAQLPGVTAGAIAGGFVWSEGVTSIALTGLTAGTYPAGTVFTVTGKYRVNPETKATIASLPYQFALKSDMVVSATNGTAIIDSAAAIYSSADSGNRQNISAALAAADVVTPLGVAGKSCRQSVMYAEQAFTATILPLDTDLPGAEAERASVDGVSTRVMRQIQSGSDKVITRFDVISVAALLRDQYAVRVLTSN